MELDKIIAKIQMVPDNGNKLNITKINQVFNQASEGIQLEVNIDYNNYIQATEKIKI